MSILSNFSTYAAMGRKVIGIAGAVAATVGLASNTDVAQVIQSFDTLTSSVLGGAGAVGVLVSVAMTIIAKNKPTTVTDVKAVAAKVPDKVVTVKVAAPK